MARFALPLIACLIAVTALPASAGAATLSREAATLVYRGETGERNVLTISRTFDDRIQFSDLTARIELRGGSGCQPGQFGTVVCSPSLAGAIRADLRDGDDKFTTRDKTPVTYLGGDGDDVFAGATAQRGAGDRITQIGPTRVDFSGGAGTDRATWAGEPNQAVSVTKNEGADDGRPGIDAHNVRGDVEELEGSRSDDFISGSQRPDTLVSGPGSDRLHGLAGDDFFDMTAAKDGPTHIRGGGNRDTVSYAQRTARVKVAPDSDDKLDGEAAEGDRVEGAEVIEGGKADDTILTMGETELGYRFDGGDGDDILSSGSGEDRLIGGKGVDSFSSGARRDIVEARDGKREKIDCGSNGDDRVFMDQVERDVDACEERILPSQIGKPSLSVRGGKVLRLRIGWVHPLDWNELDKVTLWLAHRGRSAGRLTIDQETRKVQGRGAVRVLRSSVRGRGKRVTVRAAVRIGKRYSGRRLVAKLGARGDDGGRQKPRRVGIVRVR